MSNCSYHFIKFLIVLSLVSSSTAYTQQHQKAAHWLLVDNFENALEGWIKKDTKNETRPKVANPQVTEIRSEPQISNHYLMKKPAAEGVIGNRKALTYKPLPVPVEVSETYTFYTRFQVEYFPNNHVFGLSNLDASGIEQHDYNAFEPTIRITDKMESNGYPNDGTLMVRKGKNYAKIYATNGTDQAKPLSEGIWYQLWYVVNNSSSSSGGQTYDVYLQGGEFKQQTLVYQQADFRMKREQALGYLLMNCNTGPAKQPYGNGGIMYDDIYMAKGTHLDSPIN